ncbi:MAG: hypothetical protein H7X95_11670 [Deltaproteobacteria bacterium]|nr:hypothetical protein [Deltaproteobacteria bacterium]
MLLSQAAREGCKKIQVPPSFTAFRRRCRRYLALVFALSAVALYGGGLAHAYDGGGGGTAAAGTDRRTRGTWAALLVGYIAFGTLTTAGAYLLRDNLVGRTVAVSAAGWGGLSLGAGAGYGAARISGCQVADCTGREEVAIAVGGVLGALAATIAGHLLTTDPGMSRPYTAAAGLAPALLFLSVGTITDW